MPLRAPRPFPQAERVHAYARAVVAGGNGVSVPVGCWVGGELVRYFNHCRDRRAARSAASRRAWSTVRKQSAA